MGAGLVVDLAEEDSEEGLQISQSSIGLLKMQKSGLEKSAGNPYLQVSYLEIWEF